MITHLDQLDLTKTYTYADYLTWTFKDRVELILGKIKKMSAAPSTQHQKVLGKMHLEIGTILKNQKCQVFIAPFDVRLPLDEEVNGVVYNVVQPDLCVVCDEKKIDDKGCMGAPDLIVEVLSPSSSTRDMKEKLKLYEDAKVKEYWVVNANDGIVHKYVLTDQNKYEIRYPVTIEDELISETIPNLSVSMKEIFPDVVNESSPPYEVRRI